jgi:hypothetical protein
MMGGLFAFVLALGAWLMTMPYLLAAGAIALVLWLMFRELRRQGEREIAKRKAKREAEDAILARAIKQHNLRMQGDPRGLYGVATPAVDQLNRLLR